MPGTCSTTASSSNPRKPPGHTYTRPTPRKISSGPSTRWKASSLSTRLHYARHLVHFAGETTLALECFTTLSFVAASTPRLTIGPSVMSLPLRNTVPVARAVNSVDRLFVRAVDINLEPRAG